MTKKHDPEEVPLSEDVLTLSFLDVLSCGLGASMCLFLVFSTMPHIGSQAGAGAARDQRQAEKGDAMFGSIKRPALISVVEVEVRIGHLENCDLSNDPWEHSFRSPRVIRFSPIISDDGHTRLDSVHFESADEINNPVHFQVAPPRRTPVAGAIQVKVDLFVGGSRETFPAGDDPATVNASELYGNADLFLIDMNAAEGKRISWGPKYASRGTR